MRAALAGCADVARWRRWRARPGAAAAAGAVARGGGGCCAWRASTACIAAIEASKGEIAVGRLFDASLATSLAAGAQALAGIDAADVGGAGPGGGGCCEGVVVGAALAWRAIAAATAAIDAASRCSCSCAASRCRPRAVTAAATAAATDAEGAAAAASPPPADAAAAAGGATAADAADAFADTAAFPAAIVVVT